MAPIPPPRPFLSPLPVSVIIKLNWESIKNDSNFLFVYVSMQHMWNVLPLSADSPTLLLISIFQVLPVKSWGPPFRWKLYFSSSYIRSSRWWDDKQDLDDEDRENRESLQLLALANETNIIAAQTQRERGERSFLWVLDFEMKPLTSLCHSRQTWGQRGR